MPPSLDRTKLNQEFGILLPPEDRVTFRRSLLCEENVVIGDDDVIMVKEVGSFTYFGRKSEFYSVLSIGRYCSFGQEILTGLGPHPTDWLSTSTFFYRKKMWLGSPEVVEFYDAHQIDFASNPKQITIGNDVWIGSRAIILAGVKIGHGAIIAAGAVVTKDVQPYAIVAGVPANLLRYRFNENTIQKLLDSEWWNVNPSLIKGMDYSNIPLMLNKLEEIQSLEGWEYQPKKTIIPESHHAS